MTEPKDQDKDLPPSTSSKLVDLYEYEDGSGGTATFRDPEGRTIISHYVNVEPEEKDSNG